MLITAKIVQIIFGFIAAITVLNSIAAQSLKEFLGTAGIASILILATYFLQKYIAKNSTKINLRIYKLKIYQLVLSCWGLMHLFGYFYSKSLISALWIAVVLFGIVAIQKHITKIKVQETI